MSTNLDKRKKNVSILKNKTLKSEEESDKLTAQGGDGRSAVVCPLHHFLLGFDLYQNKSVTVLISNISVSLFCHTKEEKHGVKNPWLSLSQQM